MIVIDIMKKCLDCRKKKPLDEFYKNITRKDGHQTVCKSCSHERIRNYRDTHRNEVLKYNRKRYEARGFPEKVILFRRAYKENKTKLHSNVTKENLLKKFGVAPKCYLTGIPINLSERDTYQLDHIIPVSKGGESSLENCGLTSKIANQSKRDLTTEEFYSLCRQVIDYQQFIANQKMSQSD